MTLQEFNIEGYDYTFRVAKISPTTLLAITSIINFDSFDANKTLYDFCYENLEVKVGEKWLPVKVKGKDIYQPMGIENNLEFLNKLFIWMMENVISKTFMKSSVSTEKM